MKRIRCLVLLIIGVFIIQAQEFSVSYTFKNSLQPCILSGSEALIASGVASSGEKLKGIEIQQKESFSHVQVKIQKNIRNLFYDAAVRFDLFPIWGYRLTVESVKVTLRIPKNYDDDFVMIGISASEQIPDEKNKRLTSEKIKLTTTEFREFEFIPNSFSVEGIDNVSIWLSGRGQRNELNFDIKDVTIRGYYEKSKYKPIV
ncbi:MAG: hypothetical protein ACK5MK_08585, partial [Dysgonomonas sp.]